jgi:hypothetical protein
MTGGDDDYGDAFKEAKLEHDQRQQRSAAKQRLQAEVDADAAALSNVVLPQLQAASEKLEPLGGKPHCFVSALGKQPPSTARQGR